MWLLIFWLSSPFNVSSGDACHPHWRCTAAFHTERACRAMHCAPLKKENVGEFSAGRLCFDGNTKEEAESS